MVRPTLPEGQKRTVQIRAYIKPGPAARFRQRCRDKDINEADAVREALALWMKQG